ncbi:uberolysin/carnocyclin family circular bacteriocin [Agrococcus sp. DT81.2]|uniref:uberolysin/carnocyclin family circular bacteriocin n=1 Tax=Agrococcus sp. DT81.2 TaxID=3393414 RepID=UPI003CE5895F
MHKESRRARVAVWTASVGVSVVGMAIAGLSLAWLVGSFGLSAAAASQIVTAVEMGGAALAVVSAVLGGGIAGAVISTIVWYLKRKLRKLAIA